MAAKKTTSDTDNREDFRLEEAFDRIDKIIDNLESGEGGLEDSFKQYEEGMQLIKKCSETIDRVEKRVQLIASDGSLTDFDSDDIGE